MPNIRLGIVISCHQKLCNFHVSHSLIVLDPQPPKEGALVEGMNSIIYPVLSILADIKYNLFLVEFQFCGQCPLLII